jgi:deoxyadenosine/deoxycytidine kinase
LLAKQLKWDALFEDVVDNPYLDDFYAEMQRWSFNLQIFFLHNRFKQIVELRKSGKNVIQDRTIYEDAHIFAPNLHAMGLLTARDFDNYQSIFALMEEFISPPDLLIYLQASVPTLVHQIQKRGREYETNIRIDYLNRLNERYEAWASGYDKGKMIIINVDQNKFEENPEHLGEIISKIEAEVHGLF